MNVRNATATIGTIIAARSIRAFLNDARPTEDCLSLPGLTVRSSVARAGTIASYEIRSCGD